MLERVSEPREETSRVEIRTLESNFTLVTFLVDKNTERIGPKCTRNFLYEKTYRCRNVKHVWKSDVMSTTVNRYRFNDQCWEIFYVSNSIFETVSGLIAQRKPVTKLFT